MADTLFLLGIACVIGAIVGGGLKALGTEIPVISSPARQIILAIAGIILISYSRMFRSSSLPPTTTTPPPIITVTDTPILTPTPGINGFVGTWVNIYDSPPTLGLQYALSRLEITSLDLNTAKVSACRCDTAACNSEIQLDPITALATLHENSLSNDADKFNLADHLTWKVTVRKDNTFLLVTIEEELPDGSKNNANMEMQLYKNPTGRLRPCVSPVFTSP